MLSLWFLGHLQPSFICEDSIPMLDYTVIQFLWISTTGQLHIVPHRTSGRRAGERISIDESSHQIFKGAVSGRDVPPYPSVFLPLAGVLLCCRNAANDCPAEGRSNACRARLCVFSHPDFQIMGHGWKTYVFQMGPLSFYQRQGHSPGSESEETSQFAR
uniref:AXH domain-containing protein n=1 Tax=Trichuris muris TaxID=70415 RepID=A0A5S6QEK4_TRIMR